MQDFQDISWENFIHALARWYESKEHTLGERVFAFIESELRAMIPAMIKRSWREEDIEDVLQQRLTKLIERPLQKACKIDNARAYFKAMLRRDFISGHRSRNRRSEQENTHEAKDEFAPSTPAEPLQIFCQNEKWKRIEIALAQLSIRKRVLFKILTVPSWLDAEEIGWLAEIYGKSTPETRNAIQDARGDVYALSKIFDPGVNDPVDQEIRRDRMERFRKARERARKSLADELSKLKEGP